MKHVLMKSAAIAALGVVANPVAAQQSGVQMGAQSGMNHGQHGAGGAGTGQMGMVQAGQMPATEPGQGAFAAIGEIVAALEANPDTDWSKVDINALREHLRDMDAVILDAEATATQIPSGMKFDVTGQGRVREAIQRMVQGHAAVMEGVNGWSYTAEPTDTGATLAVQVPDQDLIRLQALGFFGILTSGMHHQQHHWMMATGGGMDM